jgi:hypothetical protein
LLLREPRPDIEHKFIIFGRDNSMAAKNPAEHHFVFVVLQLRFIIVHKKPSGNLSSTDALILLTAAGSLALLAGICTASTSCFQCNF